ncbi:MAG: glycosyltransferase family 39 protein [Proteobacteria bacterium]|nr:glycosyltransferase family 39 protein [Pseudomonadota bacterium]
MADPDRARPSTLIALALIVVAALGLAASTWHVFGQTWDEPEHLAAGLVLLDTGHYVYDIQHPPLARLALAVGPYLAGARSQGRPGPDGKPEGNAVLYGSGQYEKLLTLARAGALPFLALFVVVTYLWGRTVLGPWGAVLAAAFAATTPAVLGHGALAALDVPAASTCLLALWVGARWLEHGRWREAAGLGVALGLALGTKLSAIPFCGLGAMALLALRYWERRGVAGPEAPVTRVAWWGGAALVVFLIGTVLTLAYGGRFLYLTDETHKFNQALWFLTGDRGLVHDAAYALAAHVPVPEAFQWYLGGIEAVTVHNRVGHLSYLLGEERVQGWWYFYIVALFAKTTLALLVLGLAGLGLLVRRGLAARRAADLAMPVIFLALFLFASLFSHINIGVRHILVLYPFLAVGAAVALVAGMRWVHAAPITPKRALAAGVLALLVGWHAAAVVRAWPDYLAYFNVLVSDPEHVVVDSDLDWGQDLWRLVARLHARRVPEVAIAYSGSADLAREGLPPFTLLKPDQRATGWVAVSALARAEAPQHFDWLAAYPRVERIGKTFDLYFVPPAAP